MLVVRGLRVDYAASPRALDGLNLELEQGATLGVLGPSGSGKSTLAMALLGLLPRNARASGSVAWEGRDLASLAERERRAVRGRLASLVFQEPALALNPFLTAHRQLTEAACAHGVVPASRGRAESTAILDRLFGEKAATIARSYPHQVSGGERQRLGLAVALVSRPRLLVADEATSSLDAPLRAEIIDWVGALLRESGCGLVWVTHDPSTLKGLVDRVVVLDGGRIVEDASLDQLVKTPHHGTTRTLIDATWPWPPRSGGASAGAGRGAVPR